VRETAGAAEDHHTNPFLTPGEPRNRVNDQRRWRNALRRLLTARSIAIGASALCVVAVLAVLTAVLSQSPVQSGTQPQGERGASAKSLEPLKPDLFSASANPFGTNTVVNRPAPRVRPPHRENAERPRNHPAVTPTTSAARTTVHHPVVVARYASEQRRDPRYLKQLRNRVDLSCRTATDANALHDLGEWPLRLRLQSGLDQTVEVDAPLAGHRSRHL
jgi:hypothetical protein